MAISVSYATPILVNGYLCRNCTDVGYAERHIDPAHPQDGPFGVNATADSTCGRDTAVNLGGRLGAFGAPAAATQTYAPGSLLNVGA